MDALLNIFMPIIIMGGFLGFLAWQLRPTILYFLYFLGLIKKEPILKNEPEKSVLYNATVTENGVPAREVFETLEKSGIKPNYLGMGI